VIANTVVVGEALGDRITVCHDLHLSMCNWHAAAERSKNVKIPS
jgi:hypothetical protein